MAIIDNAAGGAGGELSLEGALTLLSRAPEPAPTNEIEENEAEQDPVEETVKPQADELSEEDGAAPDTASGEDGDDSDSPAVPPVEAPSSMTEDEREVFRTLPPKAQDFLARREREWTAEGQRQQGKNDDARKALDAERTQTQQLNQHLTALVQGLQTQFQGEFADIKTPADLLELSRTDPEKFTRYQAHVEIFRNAQAAQAESERQRAEDFQKAQAEFIQKEEARLVERFPAWKDQAVGRKEIAEIRNYIIGQGATKEQADGITDAIAFDIARKAMLYDRAQEARKKALAKDPPKVLKPGVSASKEQADAEEFAASLKKVEQTGDLRFAASLLNRR